MPAPAPWPKTNSHRAVGGRTSSADTSALPGTAMRSFSPAVTAPQFYQITAPPSGRLPKRRKRDSQFFAAFKKRRDGLDYLRKRRIVELCGGPLLPQPDHRYANLARAGLCIGL